MRAPPERGLTYFAAVLLAGVVIGIVLRLARGAIA